MKSELDFPTQRQQNGSSTFLKDKYQDGNLKSQDKFTKIRQESNDEVHVDGKNQASKPNS